MSNSPLVSYTKLSPNHSGKRKHAIDTISIHCMAGNLSVERCGELFQNKERQASSNYGIGSKEQMEAAYHACWTNEQGMLGVAEVTDPEELHAYFETMWAW